MRFLDACRQQPVDVTPVWFMRQAGRSLPAYRRLRERYDFKEISANPELATQVTLMPLDVLEVDAAILFADLMTPLAMLGVSYEIVEGIGPVIDPPLDASAIQRMKVGSAAEAIPEIFETIRLVRKEIDGRLPLIGFSGAPFTIASYLIEGSPSKGHVETKRFMRTEPAAFEALMTVLTDMVIDYVREQVSSGIQAFQIFDSWVGSLSPYDYREYVLKHSQRVFDATSSLDVPRIHFGTQTSGMLELFASAGSEVVGVDWRVGLGPAWERIGNLGIQGNLDPSAMLAPWSSVERSVNELLDGVGGRPGHIFNLGHGVLPETPLDNLQRVVDLVHGRQVSS